MNKSLLSLAAITIFATSASAISPGAFYIRSDVGAFHNVRQNIRGLKIKPKTAASLDLGAGLYLSEFFRTELVFSHLFNPESKASYTGTGENIGSSSNATFKAKIEVLMLKGYFDIVDFETGKFFIGGGIGLAQVSEKATGTNTEIINGRVVTEGVSAKAKKKNNLAYTLAAGFSINLSEGINTDIQYNWSDYGHAKPDVSGVKIKRRGNAVKVGIRFDI